MKRLLSACVCLLCALCSAPPSINLSDSSRFVAPLLGQEALGDFKGSGDVFLSVNGQRAKAGFAIQWRGDSNCLVEVYGPLGGTIASMWADSAGMWTISQGASTRKKKATDPFELVEGAPYPFSYTQFMAIVMGQMPFLSVLTTPPDSLLVEEKRVALIWRHDSTTGRRYDITAFVHRKHLTLMDVFYEDKGPNPWSITFTSFIDGRSKEIRFKDGHNNYFYVRYERISPHKKTAACRKGN